MKIKRQFFIVAVAGILAATATVLGQNDDYNKVEFFAGYSMDLTKTATKSTSFTDPTGHVETFGDLCSTATGAMIGTNLQHLFCDRRLMQGFDTSLTYNVSRYIGIKGNVTGHWKSDAFVDNFTPPGLTQTITTDEKMYNFFGGIQIKDNSREKRIKPFAHVLAGVARYTNHETQTYDLFPDFNFDANDRFTSFAMKLGGGIDVRAGKRVDIRVIGVDYNPIFSKDRNWSVHSGPFAIASTGRRADNIVFSFGIVIH